MKKTLSLLLVACYTLFYAQSDLATLKSFYKKNSPAKLGKIITYNSNSNILNIDGFRFPLNKVSYYYEYNDKYYSYARHFVTVECIDDSECVKYKGDGKNSVSVPMNSKANALKLVQLLENL
ncbi:hypothetical protein [Chryseobacterium sp.]|uniref:hypothetical protein n=1 Tax=Chryseobacterium sp. TaxID=1871047 RepID=UPI000EE743AB|nr:hypothetical protein [Chryseobacterium sp.]HCM33998.1 hypothetical protein [Chryseobacterium sp.]